MASKKRAKESKPPKQEVAYSDIFIEGKDGERYTLFYKNTLGIPTSMRLDSDTYDSAKSEAASYLGVPESEVEDG